MDLPPQGAHGGILIRTRAARGVRREVQALQVHRFAGNVDRHIDNLSGLKLERCRRHRSVSNPLRLQSVAARTGCLNGDGSSRIVDRSANLTAGAIEEHEISPCHGTLDGPRPLAWQPRHLRADALMLFRHDQGTDSLCDSRSGQGSCQQDACA